MRRFEVNEYMMEERNMRQKNAQIFYSIFGGNISGDDSGGGNTGDVGG